MSEWVLATALIVLSIAYVIRFRHHRDYLLVVSSIGFALAAVGYSHPIYINHFAPSDSSGGIEAMFEMYNRELVPSVVLFIIGISLASVTSLLFSLKMQSNSPLNRTRQNRRAG